jgi:F-type H+-transporting ATPase subunit b
MPQLESWHFLPQLVWLAISFALLYLVMAFVALPRIGGVLAKRKEKIETDLDAAERARAEAGEALQAYEASLAGAREESHRLIGEAAHDAAKTAEARNHELGQAIARQIEEAGAAVAAAKDEAMEHLTAMAAEAAREATAKLIGVEVASDDVDRAVAAAKEA